jgi:YNFM family putative membrane transporter
VLCWASAAEAFFFFGAYAYIGAMLKERFGESFTLIGIALAGLGLGGLAFNTSIRWLLRRLSPQRMVLAGGLGCGSIYVAIALLPWWWPIYALMAGLGFTFYFVHNVLQTRATEAAPQARGVGVSVFGITWTIGQSLGVASSGAGIAAFGFAPMIAAFGVGFAGLGLWMRFNLHKLP